MPGPLLGTHQWAHIAPLSRYGVAVPVPLELRAISLNIVKEKGVKQPNVVGVIPIQAMKPLKAGEEGPPATGKVAPTLKPQPLNSSIVCGAVNIGYPFDICGRSDGLGHTFPT